MLPANWLQARAWRAAVPRVAAILAAAVTTLQVVPASAARYYGFIEALDSQPAVASREAGPQLQLFNTRAVAIPTNRFANDWTKLAGSFAGADLGTECSEPGTGCSTGALRWLSYLRQIRNLPRSEQLVLVNRYVNWHISYADDSEAHGARDYWANPLDAVGGRGDCEDYATAKYLSLVLLGFSDDQLRLVIVRDTKVDALHALTTVWLDGTAYVLDNRLERVMRDSDLTMYQPVYSFNQHRNWMHVAHLADAGTTARQPQS
jgi:predicted transglutaminase-like cysteine proteinase